MPSSETAAIDESTDAGKEIAAAKQPNALAMANLTMSFETEGLLGMIYKSMSKKNDWQAGLVHLVVV
jgi:hypothetical protein